MGLGSSSSSSFFLPHHILRTINKNPPGALIDFNLPSVLPNPNRNSGLISYLRINLHLTISPSVHQSISPSNTAVQAHMNRAAGPSSQIPHNFVAPLRRMSMVVRELRYRDGRLRARFRSGKWQLSDRIPRYLRDHGKRPSSPRLLQG